MGIERVSIIPRERIFTETDGPFAKHEGNVLIPWECDIALHIFSSIWNPPVEHIHADLRENFTAIVSC